jgi:hypothetical protein
MDNFQIDSYSHSNENILNLITKNYLKIENNWSWDTKSKSDFIELTLNNRNAYFFYDPYVVSRGTAGKNR